MIVIYQDLKLKKFQILFVNFDAKISLILTLLFSTCNICLVIFFFYSYSIMITFFGIFKFITIIVPLDMYAE